MVPGMNAETMQCDASSYTDTIQADYSLMVSVLQPEIQVCWPAGPGLLLPYEVATNKHMQGVSWVGQRRKAAVCPFVC